MTESDMTMDPTILAHLEKIYATVVDIDRHLGVLAKHSSKTDIGFTAQHRRYESGSEYVDLSGTEAKVFEQLIENTGIPVSIAELCSAIGIDPERQSVNMKTYVHRLRNKLGRMRNPGYAIDSIRGAGYVAKPIRRAA